MLEIVGRSSSLFTRVPRIFAEELGVGYRLTVIPDMTATVTQAYSGNPALKLPILRVDGSVLFGAQNICRAIAERASVDKRIVWPEELRDDLSRNAHELLWHCMASQVQIVMGTVVSKLPADDPFFRKICTGFENSLRWLDEHLAGILDALPPRDFSLFEVALHCLIEHLQFRKTVPVEGFADLMDFSRQFALRPSAQRTIYRFDQPPQP